jgi:hypothetical protein
MEALRPREAQRFPNIQSMGGDDNDRHGSVFSSTSFGHLLLTLTPIDFSSVVVESALVAHQRGCEVTVARRLPSRSSCSPSILRTAFSYTKRVINRQFIPLEVVDVAYTSTLTSRQSASLDTLAIICPRCLSNHLVWRGYRDYQSSSYFCLRCSEPAPALAEHRVR